MRQFDFSTELERFTKLDDVPDCSHLSQGRKLTERLAIASSARSRETLTLILRGLSLPEQGKVLEVGPGCGQYAIELCLRGYDYLGYDMVPENVELWNILKTHMQLDGDVVLQDICTIEPSAQFDGVFSISTFEHVHDQQLGLKNCFNLLRPGGRLVIIDGNLLHPGLLWNMTFVRRDGGLKWLYSKRLVREDYGLGWKGKAEDVKSLFWWKRNIRGAGFSGSCFTTVCFNRPWTRRTGLWPFFGGIVVFAQKPTVAGQPNVM